jgi:excisionase family DNA binding protein
LDVNFYRFNICKLNKEKVMAAFRGMVSPPREGTPEVQGKMAFVLTVDQVAQGLLISKPVVYGMINRGELRSIRIGNRIRIPYSALEALLEGGSAQGASATAQVVEQVAS